jgi:hypothetical protein
MGRRRRRNTMSEENKEVAVTEEVKTEEVKTEEVKTEEVETEEVVTEEVKTEEVKTEEVKTEEVKTKQDNSDIFVTEDNTFDVEIKYYVTDSLPHIEGFSDEFDDEIETKDFTVTFKFPSQRDSEIIMATKSIENAETATYLDFIEIENVRMMTLIRGWSLDRPLKDLSTVHPDIIKAIKAKISEKILGSGLF